MNYQPPTPCFDEFQDVNALFDLAEDHAEFDGQFVEFDPYYYEIKPEPEPEPEPEPKTEPESVAAPSQRDASVPFEGDLEEEALEEAKAAVGRYMDAKGNEDGIMIFRRQGGVTHLEYIGLAEKSLPDWLTENAARDESIKNIESFLIEEDKPNKAETFEVDAQIIDGKARIGTILEEVVTMRQGKKTVLQAATGSGKSFASVNLKRHVVSPVPFVSVCQDFYAQYGIKKVHGDEPVTNYKDHNGFVKIVCTFDSLWRVEEALYEDGFVNGEIDLIIDEWHLAGQSASFRLEACQGLHEATKSPFWGQIVFTSATPLPDEMASLVKSADIVKVRLPESEKSDLPTYVVNRDADLIKVVEELQGPYPNINFLIRVDNKDDISSYAEMAPFKDNHTIATSKNRLKSGLIEGQFLLATSVIDVGVSLKWANGNDYGVIVWTMLDHTAGNMEQATSRFRGAEGFITPQFVVSRARRKEIDLSVDLDYIKREREMTRGYVVRQTAYMGYAHAFGARNAQAQNMEFDERHEAIESKWLKKARLLKEGEGHEGVIRPDMAAIDGLVYQSVKYSASDGDVFAEWKAISNRFDVYEPIELEIKGGSTKEALKEAKKLKKEERAALQKSSLNQIKEGGGLIMDRAIKSKPATKEEAVLQSVSIKVRELQNLGKKLGLGGGLDLTETIQFIEKQKGASVEKRIKKAKKRIQAMAVVPATAERAHAYLADRTRWQVSQMIEVGETYSMADFEEIFNALSDNGKGGMMEIDIAKNPKQLRRWVRQQYEWKTKRAESDGKNGEKLTYILGSLADFQIKIHADRKKHG